MKSRRDFLRTSLLGIPALGMLGERAAAQRESSERGRPSPIVVSTWEHGLAANEAAWKTLSSQGHALDAVEQGVRVSEADPQVSSVGYGGLPDRDGHVTLDACIMDAHANCGSVAFLEHIKHPISIARLVMEKTPHVMLVGQGALEFALENGYEKENLLTAEAEAEWKAWLQKNERERAGADNHDTIGMVALDARDELAGSCTTSGLAWKRRGRVGDSPIIGAALYVDNEVGAACATGHGEAVIRTVGSCYVVERMRAGRSPQDACRDAIERVVQRVRDIPDLQVGYLALSCNGEFGGFSVQPGFQFAVRDASGSALHDAPSL
jgi:L-asparaginase/N4-(beta-N-acetylglucosaminyl)-L-asparaginase